jgi:hypothetical protein
MSSHKTASSKSSHKSASENNVEQAFSKLEDSLSKVQETMPKVEELALPARNGFLFNFEPVKKIAEWYIDTAEDFANHGIELQERSTIWAQGTPWAPLFQAQSSLARELVKNSALAARNLWQMQSLPASHYNSKLKPISWVS